MSLITLSVLPPHSLSFYVNPGLNCALEALVGGELDSYYGPGGALEPTVDKLITPWAGLETSWTEEPGSRRLQCVEEGKEVNPALLYLSPAPGEQFDLTIQLADQLLNYISSTIYVEVGPSTYSSSHTVFLCRHEYVFQRRLSVVFAGSPPVIAMKSLAISKAMIYAEVFTKEIPSEICSLDYAITYSLYC